MNIYEPIRGYWDKVFAKTPPGDPHAPLPVAEIEAALAWLCAGDRGSLLDFGCGHGRLVLRCLALGAGEVNGIDLSGTAIAAAQAHARQAGWEEQAHFIQGGVEALAALPDASFDGVILSNILDNLLPEDARTVLTQVRRLLRPGGRLLVRLNPYFDRSDFPVSQGYVELEPDVYSEPSGLLFWNLSDQAFENLLDGRFSIEQRVEMQQPPGRTFYLMGWGMGEGGHAETATR
jgi:arsenite methyltransferase